MFQANTNMTNTNGEPVLNMCEDNHRLMQISRVLLTASRLGCPRDPIQFLKNALVSHQGHDNLQNVDWDKFVADAEELLSTSLKCRPVVSQCMGHNDNMKMSTSRFEKVRSFYKKQLTSSCFRKWKMFITQRNRDAIEQAQRMEMAKRHFERNCQHIALTKWLNWVKLHKKMKAAAIVKLEASVNTSRLKRIIAAWHNVAKDSRRVKEFFKRSEMNFSEARSRDHLIGERSDVLTTLPKNLLLKIFQYLELRDWLNCAEVCCTWKSIIQSNTLWNWINFSTGKDWITDNTVKQILQNYDLLVVHLNLRGCTSLKWPSLQYICKCRNLQELNLSECSNVTDTMLQRIAEDCPSLLYLNLSCTLVTNDTLKEISRNCVILQYLSLAYCCRITDKGFQYLTTGKGGRKLIHLNLSGCTQMTVNGFRYISAGCPLLREVVINDMPTLSDSCVLALLARCCRLSSLSFLDSSHLSDVALKAITERANLTAFNVEGNNLLTDVSWKSLCSSSQDLCRLHAAECPRMTDYSLRSVATLKHLQYLNISLCNRVSDAGIEYLTNGSSAKILQKLNVSHCSQITDISVKRIAKRFCKLYELNLGFCKRLTDLTLEWLSGSSICSLDITGCNIKDQGLATLRGICLKKIVLAECAYITDTGIEKLCRNVRDLECVDVSHCEALSDEAIKAVSFYCRGLVVLRMSGCPKMTDAAMLYLMSGSLYLRELDVSGCTLLTDRSLRYLERICPPLASIRMVCCSSISRVAALKMQTRVSHWESSSNPPLVYL